MLDPDPLLPVLLPPVLEPELPVPLEPDELGLLVSDEPEPELPLDPEEPVPLVEEPVEDPLIPASLLLLEPLPPVPDDPDDPMLLPLLPEDPLDPLWAYAAPAPASASAPARTIVYLSFMCTLPRSPLRALREGQNGLRNVAGDDGTHLHAHSERPRHGAAPVTAIAGTAR